MTLEAIAVFVAGVDVTGTGIGGDGGATAAVVVVTFAAAAIAEGDRHGDAATGGTTATTAAIVDDTTCVVGTDSTGIDAFIVVVDADDGGVEIDVVADGADDVVVGGGIAGVDGVVAIGAVAFAAEAGDDDFAEAAEGSLLPLLPPPVARPPLNGMTGGANLRRGVSSVDGRVVDPPVDDTTPIVPPPSPAFPVSCARWSSSTCLKRSSGIDSGRGPVSVRDESGDVMRGNEGESDKKESEDVQVRQHRSIVHCSPNKSSSSSISAMSSSTD